MIIIIIISTWFGGTWKGREGTHAVNRLADGVTVNYASLCQLDVGGDGADEGGEHEDGEVLCMRTSV
jgi:hypothetical protein